jgi:hypothetical protein
MTDSLSHINIISYKVEEGQKYRICSEKMTKECIGAGDKKDFKKNVCKNCYNFKYLMKKKEKEGKVLLTDNNLNKEEIISLFQSLTSLQLIKLSGLLTSQQQSVIQTKNLNIYNCDNVHSNKFSNVNTYNLDNNITNCKLVNYLNNLNNCNSNITDCKLENHVNDFKNNDLEDQNEDTDNNLNNNSINSTKNNSLNNSSNNSSNNSFSKSSNNSENSENSSNNSLRDSHNHQNQQNPHNPDNPDNSQNSPDCLDISSKTQTQINRKPTLKIIATH